MTPGSVDDCLARLERALRQRASADARIIDEAREHLVDAIEDARQRGLSVEDAARDAFERFRAPEVVASPDRPRDERDVLLLLPPRYRSEATIHVISPRVRNTLA